MRLTGARQLGQMTPFDLVLILLIANAVQNAMVGSDVTILGGLTAAATLLAMNRAVGIRGGPAADLPQGTGGRAAYCCSSDGSSSTQPIQRAGLSDDMVMQAIREHGFDDVMRIHSAVLEVDGTISIVPNDGRGCARGAACARCGPEEADGRAGVVGAGPERPVAAEPVAARRDAAGRRLDLAAWRSTARSGRRSAALAYVEPVAARRCCTSSGRTTTFSRTRTRSGRGGG